MDKLSSFSKHEKFDVKKEIQKQLFFYHIFYTHHIHK